LAIARQEVERAEALSRQALAGALPSVNATGTVAYQIIQNPFPTAVPVILPDLTRSSIVTPGSREGPSATASITAAQPIFAPRAWYAIRTSELNVKSAKLSVDDKRRITLAQVADAIVGV